MVEGILALAGSGVAGYLSWIRLTGAAALCAGFGQCEKVLASPYAAFLGIPVAYLGLGTYAAVLVLVALRSQRAGAVAETALLMQFGLLVVAVAFSAWLTYVELYVISAVCPWCVASAGILTLLLALTVGDLVRAGRRADVSWRGNR